MSIVDVPTDNLGCADSTRTTRAHGTVSAHETSMSIFAVHRLLHPLHREELARLHLDGLHHLPIGPAERAWRYRNWNLVALRAAWPSPGRGTGLDLCCGPTLHHAAVLSKFLANVYLADPEQANRNALQAWICREPGCPDYSPFLAMVSAVEALPSTMGLAHVESRLRSALRGVLECNLGHPHLLPSVHRLFRLDVVVLLASALQDQSLEPAAQVQVLRRVGRRLRRGGLLALVGVAPPGPAPKNALEDAMLAAGYANLCWEARDMVPLGSCPSTRSFLLLANKLWEA
ncbi:hypothetical protein HPB47_008070 [Ixodes persulcatus]|uniref:Uncharacterized protein n=1 Tax=Ixodes persulcatus TaxID=34615 RepID=A0AC60P5U8_IXOPE|nr:hypothetical protein HPB47_008070 [Ixodes persulcatus]